VDYLADFFVKFRTVLGQDGFLAISSFVGVLVGAFIATTSTIVIEKRKHRAYVLVEVSKFFNNLLSEIENYSGLIALKEKDHIIKQKKLNIDSITRNTIIFVEARIAFGEGLLFKRIESLLKKMCLYSL